METKRNYVKKNPYNMYLIGEETATIVINSKTYGRFEFLIDKDEMPRAALHKWSVNMNRNSKNGRTKPYAVSNINGKLVKLHRFVSECPDDMVIDHINGDTTDNRSSNLLITTQEKNVRNRNKLNINNTTGAHGVNYHAGTNRYRVNFRLDGKYQYFGSYKTKEEAVVRAREVYSSFYCKELLMNPEIEENLPMQLMFNTETDYEEEEIA